MSGERDTNILKKPDPTPHTCGEPTLTRREISVLLLVSEGFTNKQLAQELGISESTAAEHVQNAMRKTQAKTRAGLVLFGVRSGIILVPGSNSTVPKRPPAIIQISRRSPQKESVA